MQEPVDLTTFEDATHGVNGHDRRRIAESILDESGGRLRSSHMRLRQAATELASLLDRAPRFGNPQDWPEGSRFIRLSDTLASSLSSALRKLALDAD